MSESEFYMQCEEEDLAPCQSNTNETNQLENINHVHNGNTAALPEASVAPTPSVQTPVFKTALLPIVPGSVVPQSLLAGILKSIQIAAGGTNGQPIYITPKLTIGTDQNTATPAGYILPAGQAITYLTSTQTGSVISSQLASASGMPPQAAVQIPITIIHNAHAVQTKSTITPRTSVSTSLPHTFPVISPELPSTSSSAAPPPPPPPAADDQAQNLLTQPEINIPVTGTKTPTQVPNQDSSMKTQDKVRRPTIPGTVSTKAFQNIYKAPQFCSNCNVAYKVVNELRGYMCHCNPELINSVHALTTKPRRVKRAKRNSDPVQSISLPYPVRRSSVSPPSSITSAASPLPPPCLKHITTTEIPEGVNSPGTGDYDSFGKLIMLVEDFYYGKDPGSPVLTENKVPIIMKCHLCDKKLKNNIKLMNHMKHHMELEQQRGDEKFHTMCQHCFRNFGTPFSLQCHLETVHSQVETAPLCKICDLSYDSTPIFLNHMKNTHKPGEMPYICQVCDFRSSFYYDIIIHFREFHKNTASLLCPYCLKVFRSCNSYQLHYNKHQKKTVLQCDKCRLQFLYTKDKTEHKFLYHQTYRKPVQLLGLKPGTKITIRAYSVTKVNDNTNFSKPNTNSESSSASSVPAPQRGVQRITPTKRKPVESMLEVMTKFQREHKPSRCCLCIECNFEIPDFSSHFPTFVHCSLCRYSTCCSRAYANHMISNHVPRKTTTKYLNLYKPCPKLGELRCSTCGYSTEIGDLMAMHLAKNRSHAFSHCKLTEGFSRGYKSIDAVSENGEKIRVESAKPQSSRDQFVFIPSELLRNSGIVIRNQEIQVNQNSLPQATNPVPFTNHCINPPDSSTHTQSIPSEVQPVIESTVPDENCGTQPKDLTVQKTALSSQDNTQAGAKGEGALSVEQLKIVLHALCFGIPEAASQFDSQPEEVQSLLHKRQLQLGPPKSREGLIPRASDHLAEWVLSQREQQLPVDETSLFSKAAQFMKADGGPGISYGWAVDFLINHDLSLHPLATSRRLLPHKAQERMHTFTSFINKQVTSHNLGLSSIAAMDELSVFIDMEQLDPDSADSCSVMSAFKLVGEKDPLLEIVLASLADGTILPTIVFVRGEPLSPDAPALPDIIMEAKPEGFSEEERLQVWFDKVWRRHVKPNSGGMGLLLMDQYLGHVSPKFLAMLESINTLPGVIPHACSSRLQPIEACVGLVLREFLQARWSQHVTEAPQDLIGAVPADLALLFSAWLLEMLDVLSERPEFLQRSFEPVLNSNTELAPGGFSELVQNLSEALVMSTIQEQESNEPETKGGSNMSYVFSPTLLPSPSNNQTLMKICDKDRDLDSSQETEDADLVVN